MGADITHGSLVAEVVSGGSVDEAGMQGGTQQASIVGEWLTIGGDIITAINGTKITNTDDLSTYLEEHTLPEQTINIKIVRNNLTITLAVEFGTRP